MKKNLILFLFFSLLNYSQDLKLSTLFIPKELMENANSVVRNQKLEIKTTTAIDPSIKPHIIYLLNESSDLLKDASSKYKGNGTLIVTEKPGLAKQGAAINFVVADNKQAFEYSKSNAVKGGLKTGDGLNGLAIVVD